MGQNIKKLANRLSDMSREQSEIKDNIAPQEPGAALNLFFKKQIKPSGTLTLTKKVIDPTSFVIDHPVYGEIDSATQVIDGGYDDTQDEVIESKSF